MKKQIESNDHVIGTLIDILVIGLDIITDKISYYIKLKDLARRLKL